MAQKKTISTTYLTNINQLNNEVDWGSFSIKTPTQTLDKNSFTLIAIGRPDQVKESWEMDIKDERYKTTEDLIYVMVIKNKIFKIGKSITTMKERVGSYHTGKNAYRNKPNATNSATNWYILQSVLAINEPVEIYALYIPPTKSSFLGWTYTNRVSKEVETLMIASFKKTYNKNPIGNKQN